MPLPLLTYTSLSISDTLGLAGLSTALASARHFLYRERNMFMDWLMAWRFTFWALACIQPATFCRTSNVASGFTMEQRNDLVQAGASLRASSAAAFTFCAALYLC